MIRRRVDGAVERAFLQAMITSKSFLASVVGVTDLSLLASVPMRLIAEWCVSYYVKYADCPGRNIEAIYQAWSTQPDQDEEHIKAIHDLLAGMSDDYDRAARELNVQHLLDQFGEYLSIRRLTKLHDDLEGYLLAGDSEQAGKLVQDYRSIELGKGHGFDVLRDKSAWLRAFAEPNECVIPFPPPAATFFNRALVRDGLIAVQASEKRGKTFTCIEFAIRAVRDRRRVAFFQAGDLSEGQILHRLGVRLSMLPDQEENLGEIEVPCKIERLRDDDSDEPGLVVSTRTVKCRRVLTYRESLRACRRFERHSALGSDVPYFMLSVHANSTLSVGGIETILTRWENERGFVPDVIIIDYADILAPERSRKDTRDQINETWKALRRLSQEKHALVIVPTQANALSYTVDVQTMRNFSEDHRKMAHVTGMLGLNQTPEEKEQNIMRLNWIVLREAPFNPKTCLYVGQCLALGRAFCCSTL